MPVFLNMIDVLNELLFGSGKNSTEPNRQSTIALLSGEGRKQSAPSPPRYDDPEIEVMVRIIERDKVCIEQIDVSYKDI